MIFLILLWPSSKTALQWFLSTTAFSYISKLSSSSVPPSSSLATSLSSWDMLSSNVIASTSSLNLAHSS